MLMGEILIAMLSTAITLLCYNAICNAYEKRGWI